MRIYKYGMRLRGMSPGAQPKEGFYDWQEDHTGTFYNIILYTRELSRDEIIKYDLSYIGWEELQNGATT